MAGRERYFATAGGQQAAFLLLEFDGRGFLIIWIADEVMAGVGRTGV